MSHLIPKIQPDFFAKVAKFGVAGFLALEIHLNDTQLKFSMKKIRGYYLLTLLFIKLFSMNFDFFKYQKYPQSMF